MKKIIGIFLCAAIIIASIGAAVPSVFAAVGATYYIDSVGGDDSLSGTSPDTAWKTAAKILSVTLSAGDKVLFKKGCTFDCAISLTCSGTAELPIVISSYGDGDATMPILHTDAKTEVLQLIDCSFVTVSNLEITAPNGGGIWIDTLTKTSIGVTLQNLKIHNIQNYKVTTRDNLAAGACNARACVMVKGLPARSRFAVDNLTITDCEMYDCGNGISLWGSWNDSQTPWCEEKDIDPIFNKNSLVRNVYFHDMDAEAIIVGICDGALVTGCRSINCCQGEGKSDDGIVLYYTAAMWFWGSINSTIERTEIAGQKNAGDGMAVDFDSFSHNCTYQYIYSHDNTRFMCNCPNHSGHHGNTVRYCLSVNDNRGLNTLGGGAQEYGINFYNNTVIGCANFDVTDVQDAYIANNIIMPQAGYRVIYEMDKADKNVFMNNCYYNCFNPIIDSGSMNVNPGFSGSDYSISDSFTLATGSPLIGAGVKIDDGLTTDFFGNEITSNNIGCYQGSGTDAKYKPDSIFVKIFNFFKVLIGTIKAEIDNAIYEAIDYYNIHIANKK